MIENIKIKKAVKKVEGRWKQFTNLDLKTEKDIDGVLLQTTEGNIFKISLIKKK